LLDGGGGCVVEITETIALQKVEGDKDDDEHGEDKHVLEFHVSILL
jgi:hypothetical protein